jgi:amino acid transporter
VALVPVGKLEESDTPLVEVVKAGAPGLPIDDILPFMTMFAVSNTALINMLMASRLIYGMSRQHVLPPVLGKIHPTRLTPWIAIVFTTLIAFGLIFYVTAFANSKAISLLGGTTSLLLLAVFAVVNVAVLVLRRDVQATGGHFKTPTVLPVIGCITSLYLVTPLSGRPGQQYVLAGILIVIGIVLFFITMAINRRLGVQDAGIKDPTRLAEPPD